MKPSVVDTVVRTKTQVSVLQLRLASCQLFPYLADQRLDKESGTVQR